MEQVDRQGPDLTARVRMDGVEGPILVRRTGAGRYRVEIAGRRLEVAVAGDASADWGAVDGQVYRWPRASGADDGVAEAETALAASTPATVTVVEVGPGDRVSAGDTLVVLEAMKMQMPIVAPRAGRVAAVRCAVGDQVQPGVPLVELDPEG